MNAKSGRARALIVLLFLLATCRASRDPLEPSDLTGDVPNALYITLTKAIWTWDEVAFPQGSGVRATLTNASERTLESTLGDKFNSAAEQVDLYVVKGGSSALEWRDASGVWRVAALAPLVEGVKPVVLRRGGVYRLTTLLFGPRQPGIYRIRVDFFDVPAGGVRYSDYSSHFEIR
jgi:hypothetical protein